MAPNSEYSWRKLNWKVKKKYITTEAVSLIKLQRLMYQQLGNVLRPFGKLYIWLFGTFSPFWYVAPRKTIVTMVQCSHICRYFYWKSVSQLIFRADKFSRKITRWHYVRRYIGYIGTYSSSSLNISNTFDGNSGKYLFSKIHCGWGCTCKFMFLKLWTTFLPGRVTSWVYEKIAQNVAQYILC
jgi:hypothetical protein